MEIFVYDENYEVKIIVNPEEKLLMLQDKLYELFTVTTNRQALILDGKLLDFNKSLNEQNVPKGAKIELYMLDSLYPSQDINYFS